MPLSSSPVSGLGAGAATARWLVVAHSGDADCSSRRAEARGSRARPGSTGRARVCRRRSAEGGGLHAERGELTRAGDRDDAGGLAALLAQDASVMQSALARQEISMTRVLAVWRRASRRRGGPVAVVMGGFDEQAAGVDRAGFGDHAWRRWVGGVLVGTIPRNPDSARAGSVPVADLARSAAADSVSIPEAAQPRSSGRPGFGDHRISARDQRARATSTRPRPGSRRTLPAAAVLEGQAAQPRRASASSRPDVPRVLAARRRSPRPGRARIRSPRQRSRGSRRGISARPSAGHEREPQLAGGQQPRQGSASRLRS